MRPLAALATSITFLIIPAAIADFYVVERDDVYAGIVPIDNINCDEIGAFSSQNALNYNKGTTSVITDTSCGAGDVTLTGSDSGTDQMGEGGMANSWVPSDHYGSGGMCEHDDSQHDSCSKGGNWRSVMKCTGTAICSGG